MKHISNQSEALNNQIWVLAHDQYGISALVSQMSLRGETTVLS